MQWYKKALGILFCLILTWNTLAQVVYEPTYHTVYPYLSRLAQKGVIELDDVVLPLSKDYIYQKLDELSKNITALTPLEREELAFYLKEYTLWWRKDPKSGFEGEYKSILKTKIGDRFRFLSYQDDNFTVNVQPIYGYSRISQDSISGTETSAGVWAYGYIGKNIGFNFDFRTNKSFTSNGYDYAKVNSPEQGRIGYIGSNKDVFDYNVFNANITAKWKWGSASFGKSPLELGYGMNGKIILSDKAPSFPNVRLNVTPVKWLSFFYSHGWLNSLVVDSTTIYPTSNPVREQYSFRNKYFVIHSLTWRAFKGFSFTMGESAVYNDQVKVAYLIPFVLFSTVNHYLGEAEGNNTISNSQIFFQFSSRNHLPKSHIYFSFFVDELSLKGFGINPERNHTAYQLGWSGADILLNNLSLGIQYTRIRPFVYVHFIPVQTYANNGYNLGHWLGQNSDQLLFNSQYRIARGFITQVEYELVQKGEEGSPQQQVKSGDYPFLWGVVQKRNTLGISFSYEIIHDLFFKFKFQNVTVKDIFNVVHNNNSTSVGIQYGF